MLHPIVCGRVGEGLKVWRAPGGLVALRGEEVHVWRVWLDVPAWRRGELWGLLDGEERGRAERYRFERDRAHFVVARGTLRRLLGEYLAAEPGAIRFGYGAYGKPALAGGAGAGPTLRFNLSHSGGVALYAFALGRELGVDVERVRDGVGLEELAVRFFAADEAGALLRLPAEQRERAFFNCWTRKEAYVKARGEGLSHPLDSFSVTLAPGEAAALLETRNDPREAGRWRLYDLDPAPGYAGALVVEAGHGPVNCFSL